MQATFQHMGKPMGRKGPLEEKQTGNLGKNRVPAHKANLVSYIYK